MGRAAHSGGCRQDDPVEAELLASLRRDNAPRKIKQTPSKPNIASDKLDACRDFYAGLLGFQVAMDMGWILTFVSRATPTAQLSVVREDATAPVVAQVTVEVADVDAVHAQAVRRGLELVHPLTDEPWGAALLRQGPQRGGAERGQ